MDYLDMLAKNLRRIRKQKKITQVDIANKLGVNKALVSQWENGVTKMNMAQMMEIANAYGIDVEQMMDAQDSKGNWYYRVPFLGKIQCGLPIFAQENINNYKMLPVEYRHKGHFFYLKAQGDSMVEADIEEGDWLLMKQTSHLKKYDIGAFLFKDNEEVTLKIFIPDYENNRVILRSANDDYKDIVIAGKDCERLIIFAKLEQVEKRTYTLEDILENI